MRLRTLVLAAALLPAAAARPAVAAEPPFVWLDLTPLNALDLNDAANRRKVYDLLDVVVSLQGNVNRKKPQLYVNYIAADAYWLSKLQSPGGWLAGRQMVKLKAKEPKDLDALITTFRSQIGGLVLWDPKVPATTHVASTVAGADNLIAVRYDTDPASACAWLVTQAKVAVKVRLVNADGSSLFTGKGKIPGTDVPSTGSAKCDAYRWVIANYVERGKCDAALLGNWVDAFWIGAPLRGSHNLPNRDYVIARKGIVYDLSMWKDETPVDDPDQPPGADYETWLALLRACNAQTKGDRMIHHAGFVPWNYKYTEKSVPPAGKHGDVESEWRAAETLSQFNCYMDADAHGPSILCNASFYMHLPLEKRYPQNPKPTRDDLKRRGFLDASGKVAPRRYIAFYVGDYDSAAWLGTVMPGLWDDRNRGSLPLGWAVDPNLCDRVPQAMAYLWKTRTKNDVFVAGDSGAGYVNPGGLRERPLSGLPDAFGLWARHCKPYFDRWDITLTGFIIDGNSPGLPPEGKDAYAEFSPDGIVAQKVPETGLRGTMPILRMGRDLDKDSPAEVLDIIRSLFRPRLPQFLIYRSILKSPTWHKERWEYLRKEMPSEPVELVDPYTLLLLVRAYEEERRGDAWKDKPQVGIELTVPPACAGVWLRDNDDGAYEAVTQGGKPCLKTVKNRFGDPRFLYFDVAESWAAGKGPVTVEIEYYDGVAGEVVLQYDSVDDGADGIYKTAGSVKLAGGPAWKTATFTLSDPGFRNRGNAGSDFRIAAVGFDLCVRRVALRRKP